MRAGPNPEHAPLRVYVCPHMNELSLEAPPLARGGILAEEMGLGKFVFVLRKKTNRRKKKRNADCMVVFDLGKTIEVLSLVALNPAPVPLPPAPARESLDESVVGKRAGVVNRGALTPTHG